MESNVRLVGGMQWLSRTLRHPFINPSQREITQLRRVVAIQRAELAVTKEALLERDRLIALLKISERYSQIPNPQSPPLAARVIAHDPRAMFKTLVINRGTDAGVRKGMIAVAGAGLVGRVEQVAAHEATIVLLIDPNHAVDVWVQRSRIRGLLTGSGRSMLMHRLTGVTRLEYLAETADILADDVVVTTGLDGRYPKGIPVGTVRTIWRGAPGMYTEAEVVPFVDWEAVEEVALIQ